MDAKRARRDALLRVARDLFIERGFSSTSVSAIVQAAGVAQGTFYLYFPSKQKVLLHLRAQVLDSYVRAFGEAAEAQTPDEPVDQRIVRGLRRILETVDANRPLVRVFREATTSQELQRVWIEGRERLSDPFGSLIRAGVEDGSFDVDDPALAAHIALAIFDDLLYEALEFGVPADPERTLAHAARFLLRALRCDEARVQTLVPLSAPKGDPS